VLDEKGALVVEDQQRGFFFDEVGEGSEEGAADVEADPPHENGPNTVVQRRGGPGRRARWFTFRSCFPCCSDLVTLRSIWAGPRSPAFPNPSAKEYVTQVTTPSITPIAIQRGNE